MKLSNLPEVLARQAEKAWELILDRADETTASGLREYAMIGELADQLPRVLACSPFVADLSRRKPALLLALLDSQFLARSLPEDSFREELSANLTGEAELGPALRLYRQRHMLRIVWRDFSRTADTLETVRDTSLLAEACIAEALVHTQAALEQRFGKPIGRTSGEHQTMIVLAMGKLGARELNVSSDIDLIFAFPEAGVTDGETRNLSNEEFFIKVGQAVITALDQTTPEGFVFRVDMRLRPYGDSGALVHNFNALEEYYQDQGRDWERYALIKARPVTGDPARADELMKALRPFVFRRYIDFGVIESLRSMKQMISAEVRRRGLQGNVKLGHGGIREVEFIAQCFQLIRGGRDLALQQRELLIVLQECVELGCLPAEAVEELRTAYLFLRDSEHAIQGYQDKQTQELPGDEMARIAMAEIMGFERWETYLQALDEQRATVSRHFNALIAVPEDEQPSTESDDGLWGEDLNEAALAELGYRQLDATLGALGEFWSSKRVSAAQAEGRERLDVFMPQLIRCCADTDDPDLALTRVLPLVVSVVRRSAYLALLLENPPALRELAVLCGASPWIAEQMAKQPVLLDEFLDRASLYNAPDKDELQNQLQQQVARLNADDLEAQMNALRYFKAAQVLRVAASELSGRLPVMKVSDNLTWIAEVILEHVIAVAWADLSHKYGEPKRESDGYGFAIYGYGKLGGLELGYGSDLDLVFVCDAARQGSTSGERNIDNAVFYTRLGQRIIHILETRMSLGQLYEVDMRLRPDGNSGSLVPSVDAFAKYQKNSAWTWEHQALVRARFVAGDPEAAAKVDMVRREILCLPRDAAELGVEVVKMRRKMRDHLLPSELEGEFHLKQGSGGIVDIEFMVQYAVLAWAAQHPDLATWPDNVRILEVLGREGLFSSEDSAALTEAYLQYRGRSHQLALQQRPGVTGAAYFHEQRQRVERRWQTLFGELPDAGGDA
ncbi:bifunctional [glutamate--ammonia ligase]-adenylyl-L-tyrosine phosphorylase/[glutamate--ammonia-ligase] adenylyltransferase [Halioglobus maricola]|uniref:Bifunctional glutamine synthetase adenylyltransferase/adenylyl-removing enzyme n=1 Tax=Halioglobus maricola TaxID=2601894 RepID=A0A5P9NER5_9GAMM|nr:bifunctional [glutamate--ammonia ligase]-adenylyl-L-tyrosine phosphorylase/[glutamate--ammonia-ligase] adenylyltransferase [Halioglobus maricola]QFU74210.1 bifunctional [glutamate--ammonia ligase]-adenylyl-L-tyrosine phosphorylase/[glutamate--ammonia-ligase] adenylyltransferase [Halioglobus maricola]